MRSRRRHRDQGGFTLLEMLIALTLVSLIMVMLFGGLRLASRTWEGVERKALHTESQRLARGFLRRVLAQAPRISWRVEQKQHVAFWGGPEQMEFVTPLAGRVGLSGIYLMRLTTVSNDDGGRDLILQRWLLNGSVLGADAVNVPRWQPLEPPGSVEVPMDGPMGVYGTSLLLKNVGDLELSYFGKPGGGRFASEWQQDWDKEIELPELVRIRLPVTEDWPDLVVRLGGE
jgi:general secretion pathway protein J